MEVPCPQCGQLLRVPEGLRFARIRCRACEHIFTTSAGDSSLATHEPAFPSLANRERYESDRATPLPVPSVAEFAEVQESSAHFDSSQETEPSTTDAKPKSWKARFGLVFLIVLAIVTKGPHLVKHFQPKRKPPAPIVRPVHQARDPQRKLGEELMPPKQPFFQKFKKANVEPPAEKQE